MAMPVDNSGIRVKSGECIAVSAWRSNVSFVEIRLNGETAEVPEGASLVDLVARLGLEGRRVAIECNQDIIPRDRHAAHILCAGDVVEVVQFVGGG